MADLHPSAVVLVATVRALKSHGGVPKPDLNKPNVEPSARARPTWSATLTTSRTALACPSALPINAFPTDTPEEMAVIEEVCAKAGVKCALSEVFAKGGEGGKAWPRPFFPSCRKPPAHPVHLRSGRFSAGEDRSSCQKKSTVLTA